MDVTKTVTIYYTVTYSKTFDAESNKSLKQAIEQRTVEDWVYETISASCCSDWGTDGDTKIDFDYSGEI